MAASEEERRHTIVALVDNEPGVLARVIGLFSGRGYNIDSLTVAPVDKVRGLSRINIVTTGSEFVIEQIKSLLAKLAQNRTLSTIITLQTGTPLTITAGSDRNFDGLTNDRADLAGNPELDHGRPIDQLIEGWFNVGAFAVPAVGTDGNSGRNIIDGPGVRNVDLGIFRDIPLKGRSMFQFRLEATNVFNIVNLNGPGTGLNALATFGKIRSARNMRQIQLGARVSF